MSASHPQAHIGLPAICTAKLVIIYLKTVVFNEKYSEKWHLPDAAEGVCYLRRSRFAHHRLICNLIPSVYICSKHKKPRDYSLGQYVLLFLCLKRKTEGLLPRQICTFVLVSKYGLCRRLKTAYLNGTHPTAYHLYRAINYPVTLNESRKGLLSITILYLKQEMPERASSMVTEGFQPSDYVPHMAIVCR